MADNVQHIRAEDAHTPDPANLQDIIERRDEAFSDLPLDAVTLYIAHVKENRSPRSLSRQTKRSVRNIKRSIEYVAERLRQEFPDHADMVDINFD